MRDRYASLREGLVGAWIPSISGSGLLLPDLSGNGNNGTLTNMDASDWVSSQYGRALDFDGVDDHVPLTPFNLKTYCPSVACVSLWVYPRTYSRNAYLADWNSSGGNESFRIEMSGFAMTANRIGGAVLSFNSAPVQTSASVSLNTWHLIGIQRTSAGQELYWNGFLDASNNASAAGTALSNPIVLGRAGSLAALYANAQVADARIWNRYLTSSEHLELYRLGPGIGLRPQRRTMYYVPPTGARRRRILTSMP